jgi:AcrR family transcriptional regulator
MPTSKGQKNRKSRTVETSDLGQRILEQTIALARDVGWEQVRLRRIAEDLGIPLPELLVCYRDLDAVADAWFARALKEMLAPMAAGFADLPGHERVYLVMMRWFEAQRDERAVVGQMLSTKLYPAHPHHWVPMVFSLSRLIQWQREVSYLDATGRRRQVEEIGLTLLFLAALRVWLRDDSPNFEVTRQFLRHRLKPADRLLTAAFRRGGPTWRPGESTNPFDRP